MSDKIQKIGNEPINATYFKDGEIDGCGLTRREYFAVSAMNAILSNSSAVLNGSNDEIKFAAYVGVKAADELLKALENEEKIY
ncbi:hypothetical protein [Chryseobacterium sp. JV274]|uniref:hypothetical protein n=1 Tax=Chryseobacterium sp. JV274 TaxID=1932669 RepID=UPI000986311D|nr:hypothetical protein [Chryseobacterium sp. JV274]